MSIGWQESMKNVRLIKFNEYGNWDYGYLTPVEQLKDIPFDIKRIYYITRVPSEVTRGFHSHKCLQQVLICLNGSVKIRTKTPYEEAVYELNQRSLGLYIGPMIWREMFDFSDNAVLLTLASEYYSEEDYIRDYESYLIAASKYFS
jgi:dTDP-4-dehydrorhamnose 3,5-epimerase-like enzyme